MSREEAIKRIRDFGLYHAIEDLPHSTKTVEAFEMAIQALEVPERKRGKWIQRSDMPWYYYCSNCHRVISVASADQIEKFHAFCGTCGADMRKETDDG